MRATYLDRCVAVHFNLFIQFGDTSTSRTEERGNMDENQPVFRFSPVSAGITKDVFRFRWQCGCVFQQCRDGSDVRSLPCTEHSALLSALVRNARPPESDAGTDGVLRL